MIATDMISGSIDIIALALIDHVHLSFYFVILAIVNIIFSFLLMALLLPLVVHLHQLFLIVFHCIFYLCAVWLVLLDFVLNLFLRLFRISVQFSIFLGQHSFNEIKVGQFDCFISGICTFLGLGMVCILNSRLGKTIKIIFVGTDSPFKWSTDQRPVSYGLNDKDKEQFLHIEGLQQQRRKILKIQSSSHQQRKQNWCFSFYSLA